MAEFPRDAAAGSRSPLPLDVHERVQVRLRLDRTHGVLTLNGQEVTVHGTDLASTRATALAALGRVATSHQAWLECTVESVAGSDVVLIDPGTMPAAPSSGAEVQAEALREVPSRWVLVAAGAALVLLTVMLGAALASAAWWYADGSDAHEPAVRPVSEAPVRSSARAAEDSRVGADEPLSAAPAMPAPGPSSAHRRAAWVADVLRVLGERVPAAVAAPGGTSEASEQLADAPASAAEPAVVPSPAPAPAQVTAIDVPEAVSGPGSVSFTVHVTTSGPVAVTVVATVCSQSTVLGTQTIAGAGSFSGVVSGLTPGTCGFSVAADGLAATGQVEVF